MDERANDSGRTPHPPAGRRPVSVQAADPEARERIRRILESPSYIRAYEDTDFLMQHDLRSVRLQLELLKPELILRRHRIHTTIVVFGGTRIVEPQVARARVESLQEELRQQGLSPELERRLAVARRVLAKSRYYDEAREFGRLVSSACQRDEECDYVIVTGGGPGIMEAANRGAFDAGAKSVGLNITLPMEQYPNSFITPELCFQFHYFAIRKLHFLLRAKALVAFPGGYGTLDELFEALTLVQTHKTRELPVILFGREFWERAVDFEFLAREGTIASADLDLFRYAETAAQAWEMIQRFHAEH
ncbi:MAG: LOG family protein, partial [Candidatus Krumholzibacteriia bacterium]